MEKRKSKELEKEKNIAETIAPTRGRIFKGIITKKFPTRVVVEFERTIYVPKYERYYRKKTRLHSRLPQGLNVEVGDLVKVQECRPLSKIINSIVIEKISSGEKTK